MKIALVNTITPFIRGGAEILVDDLFDQLQQRGHRVTLFRLPFPNEYEVQLQELVLAGKFLDFTSYDRVIAFKFPAYCVCHPHKVLWLFHQFRQVYDLYGKEYGIQETPEGRAVKKLVENLDRREIGGAERVYVNAEEVANRLFQYNGLHSEILTPPLLNWERYQEGRYGDYLYYPSRVNSLKRQYLAVESMRYVQTDVKLMIDGLCPDETYDREIRNTIKKYGLESRVIYRNEWVSDEEKIDRMANCLAALYIPYLEDSCGFVTFEGFYSGKPVLTCTDSGGTKEFVTEGVTGYFSSPDPQELAKKMDLLYLNRKKTIAMGKYAKHEIIQRNITWDETVRRLLQ